jgi:predicted helicase
MSTVSKKISNVEGLCEGLDIPHISCCMFLDKIDDRNTVPFIQCIGRVLKKEDENHKTYSHVLDAYKKECDKSKVKNSADKILDYYGRLYGLTDNSMLLCANKCREGLDIPNFSHCMFLNKVDNRDTVPFIQCIGRVLRKNNENHKKNGYILDGCVKECDNSKVKNIVNITSLL